MLQKLDLNSILVIIAPILTAVVTGISIVIGIVMTRWQIREKTKSARIEANEKLKIMKINSEVAVQSVEQMYWDRPNDEKKALGLAIAKKLNASSGIINIDNSEILPFNEASVLKLPKTDAPKIVPVPDTTSAYGRIFANEPTEIDGGDPASKALG